MKARLVKLLVTSIFLGSLLISCGKEKKLTVNWITDFEQAKEQAAKEDKGILILFTGSDWDKYSNDFKKTVCESNQFIKEFSKNYVFLNLDYAEKEFNAAYAIGDLSEEEAALKKEQQENFEKKVFLERDIYAVKQHPSIYFVTQEGWYLDSVPYTEEFKTASDFSKAVNKAQVEKLTKLAKNVRTTEGTVKANYINELFESTPAIYLASLKELAENFVIFDPENETGFLGKFEVYRAYFEASFAYSAGKDSALVFIAFADDKTNHLNNAERQNMYSMAAFIKLRDGKDNGSYDYDAVIEYLQKAYEADPENTISSDILQRLEQAKKNAAANK